MSPSTAAVRNRQFSLALDAAKKRGDIAEMQRLLGELTALMQTQFGYPKKPRSRLICSGVSAQFRIVEFCTVQLIAAGCVRIAPQFLILRGITN